MNELKSIPDGDYIGKLINLEVKVSLNGHKYLEWRFLIESGNAEGTEIVKRNFVTSPKSVEFLKTELERIGVEAERAENVDKQRHLVIGKRVRITVQNQEKASPNYYIQELLDDTEAKDDGSNDLW